MDWILVVCLYLATFTTLSQVQCIRINPYTGFFNTNFDPLTEYSINQGSYIPNMPVASIYPMMNDDSFNAMGGMSSLKPHMVPFVNPLQPSVPQINIQRPHPLRTDSKNARHINQRSPNGNPRQLERNVQPKTQKVTLDITGGGYKVEKPHKAQPYKAPVAESTNQNSQRQRPNERNVSNGNRNNGRPNQSPHRDRGPIQRRPNQRPRGPTLQNPHFNMKFEASSHSMPPNVEFVNPENVLPFHPRIYKQFLQQNKQFAASYQNLNRRNPFKTSSQRPASTRNRNKSPVPQSSQLSTFSPNFNMFDNSFSNPSAASQFSSSFPQKADVNQFTDLFNSDPSFYSAWSKTPEGRVVLGQLKQQAISNSNPHRTPLSNNYPQPPNQNIRPPSYDTLRSPSLPSGTPSETAIPSYMTNYYDSNNGAVPTQYEGSHQSPNPSNEYQQIMSYYQQQQSMFPGQQHSSSSGLASPNRYRETAQAANYPSNYPKQVNSQIPNEYQFFQGQGSVHQHSHSPTYSNNPHAAAINPYEESSFSNSYQATHNNIKSQMSNNPHVDQGGYTLPSYTPSDPLAQVANNHQEVQDYYGYQHVSNHPNQPQMYSNDQSPHNFGQGALHEISPYSTDEKTTEEASMEKSSHSTKSGYSTPEQLLASTSMPSESKFGFPSSRGGSSKSTSSVQLSEVSSSTEVTVTSPDDQREGNDRAALHLPMDTASLVNRQPENQISYEFPETHEPLSYSIGIPNSESDSLRPTDVKESSSIDENESDEKLHHSILEFQKLLTKAPKSSYMVKPTEQTPRMVKTTTRKPIYQRAPESDVMKNHRTTHSYMFQYAPTVTKTTPTWHAWRANASRYHLPIPEFKPQTTAATSATQEITTTSSLPTTTTPSTTSAATPSMTVSYYHEPETPICARQNNLTYCLQDPLYPKQQIKEAIEKNRHPLDHFLVDISSSSNAVDDNINKVIPENSVPLQSTSVSYSYEGKTITPIHGETINSTSCPSSVYYAKPLRAINTAGLWKIIVNVEFEETGANYTQTVRVEECNHTTGYIATCGGETISACLQQYKLFRLLAWEQNRGFYIDAFLLPISCFCGSQQ